MSVAPARVAAVTAAEEEVIVHAAVEEEEEDAAASDVVDDAAAAENNEEDFEDGAAEDDAEPDEAEAEDEAEPDEAEAEDEAESDEAEVEDDGRAVPPAGSKFSPTEDEELLAMRRAGQPWAAIARRLKRSSSSLQARFRSRLKPVACTGLTLAQYEFFSFAEEDTAAGELTGFIPGRRPGVRPSVSPPRGSPVHRGATAPSKHGGGGSSGRTPKRIKTPARPAAKVTALPAEGTIVGPGIRFGTPPEPPRAPAARPHKSPARRAVAF